MCMYYLSWVWQNLRSPLLLDLIKRNCVESRSFPIRLHSSSSLNMWHPLAALNQHLHWCLSHSYFPCIVERIEPVDIYVFGFSRRWSSSQGKGSSRGWVTTGAEYQPKKISNLGRVPGKAEFQSGQGSCEGRVPSDKVHALSNVLR